LTKVIQRISHTTSLAVLIPDHLGNRLTLIDKEKSLLNAIDYFLVTNESLLACYKRDYPEKCKGILHDMPDVDAIEKVYKSKLDAGSGVIWVGNSKWGKKKGMEDHKRLYELVYPLIQMGVGIEIIDSAVNRRQNTDVLNRIVKRKFLIQTSKEEGTGLPILEACALGVIPITTDVGVANELLSEELSSLIVGPNVVDFIAAMEWADNDPHLPNQLKDRFTKYIHLAKQEELFFESKKSSHKIKSSYSVQFMTLAIWVVRSIRYRFK
jgi:glycosyltransferase involved in cell wall biosynthesis